MVPVVDRWSGSGLSCEKMGLVHVLIAPDHFGGALSAPEAASALARGWLAAGHQVTTAPMSDGGTGLVEAVHSSRGGTLLSVEATGPLGQRVPAAVLHVPVRGPDAQRAASDDGAGPGGATSPVSDGPAHHAATAYAETGQVLGAGSWATKSGENGSGAIERADDPDGAARRLIEEGSSAGVADLLLAALDTGARRVVLGAGPSPTHDGGAGLWRRLAQAFDLDVPAEEPWLALGPIRERLRDVDLVVAAAGDLPLIGLHGAGAALQRLPGLTALDAQQVERRISAFADQAQRHADSLPPLRTPLQAVNVTAASAERAARQDYAGAGGGSGFALSLLGARVLPGASVIAAEIGLTDTIESVDLVITGAAALDAEAMHDGVVATVGAAAAHWGLPAVALAHEVGVNRRELAKVGISAAYPVQDQRLIPTQAPPDPVVDLREALAMRGERLVRNWAPRS